jgi:hypothetical protein
MSVPHKSASCIICQHVYRIPYTHEATWQQTPRILRSCAPYYRNNTLGCLSFVLACQVLPHWCSPIFCLSSSNFNPELQFTCFIGLTCYFTMTLDEISRNITIMNTVLFVFAYWFAWIVYCRTWHPLARIPGPLWPAVSRTWAR